LVAGLDHEPDGLQRQGRPGHALDRSVVQVAGDAVAFGLDGRVRSQEKAGPVLVPVLEELEQRTDGLLRQPALGDVPNHQRRTGAGAWPRTPRCPGSRRAGRRWHALAPRARPRARAPRAWSSPGPAWRTAPRRRPSRRRPPGGPPREGTRPRPPR